MSADVTEFSLRTAYSVHYKLSESSDGVTFRYYFNDEHALREVRVLVEKFGWKEAKIAQMTPEGCEALRLPHRVRVVS